MRLEKFVLNPAAFRQQILKGDATKALLASIVGEGAEAEEAPSRARSRVYGAMDDEAQNGTLSRRIGGWRV